MTFELPASASIYTPAFLRFLYDFWVHGLSNRLAWKVPTTRLQEHFERNVGPRHLEAGPGTGFLADRCRLPGAPPRLVLLDANPHCLVAASRRLARYGPECVQADLMAPLSLPSASFDSIHLGYVLHCLPGPMERKAKVLDHLAPLLGPGGVVFGSTILPDGGNRLAKAFTRAYNRKGIFGNLGDTQEGLRQALQSRFPRCQVERVGQVALFTARTA